MVDMGTTTSREAAMQTIETTYTTSGSVRGTCGHQHHTVEAAAECMARDARACRSLGGGAYSDRHVIAVVDGQERDLAEQEREDLWAWQDAQYR